MRNKTIYLSLTLLTAFCVSANAKINVGGAAVQPQVQKVAAGCLNTTAQFDLDVNNVRARILNGGDLWWDPIGQTPYYEVPIGSGKNAIFSGALWIAGLDNNNQIKAACQTYRQLGANDFWAGPISKDALGLLDVSEATCEYYDNLKRWAITKEEVENFVKSGEATEAIRTWPGNGNVALGQLPALAPFVDVDNDGIYNYAAGDYPGYNLSGNYPEDPISENAICNDYLFGDRTIWWVFNDVGNSHTETFSATPIGMEVRAQAFGFRTADDINNMTFYKYQIINRSNDVLNNTYFGVWCDPDLGNASDDYVGCDVGLGLGYCYNADPDDEGAGGYGLNPPAVGIDFFQGPLADAGDGIDNDKDGDIDEIGEQISMAKFMYYENTNQQPNGNPEVLDDYYQYLSGIWLDGQAVTYSGNGRDPGNPNCNYMFPGLTDPQFPGNNWTMATAGIQGTDMRFLQSAGVFTLQPGAVNYITTGVVWAKASAGGPEASVTLIKLADQKAQALFDNCFKVLDGPNAPVVEIREFDQRLILKLEDTRNNKIEYYNEIDPTIPLAVPNDSGGFDTLAPDQRSFKFQGYRVYQLASKNVSSQELGDPSKARLIRQIDMKDDIYKIVNFEFDNDLLVWFPTQVADSNTTTNQGLVHDIVVTTDQFTGQSLINYRPYYYMAVSYGYNNFATFDPANSTFTQAKPFKQGRLGVKVYSGIPHRPVVNNGGMVMNSSYGTSFEVRRMEGQGNGGNVLDFTEATVNEILTSPDHLSKYPVYTAGHGPINIQVYDPVMAHNGDLKLMFEPLTATNTDWGLMKRNAPKYNIVTVTTSDELLIVNTDVPTGVKTGEFVRIDNVLGGTNINKRFYEVASVSQNDPKEITLLADGASGVFTPASGTLEPARDRSTFPVNVRNSQLNEEHGVKFDIYTNVNEFGSKTENNGFLEASITENSWLSFLPDNDGGANASSIYDWIQAGTNDPDDVYEDVLGGTWAPVKILGSNSNFGMLPSLASLGAFLKSEYVASVDVVFTPDKTKWTRCVVLEMAPGSTTRFYPRTAPSLNKDFNASAIGDTTDPNSSNFINNTGMSWFPGYAINLETGERLNIAFGENSLLTAENGNDMMFNPTSTTKDAGGVDVVGGMHFLYIFGHNLDGANDVPKYDYGQKIIDKVGSSSVPVRRGILKDMMWASVPMARYGVNFNDGIPKSEVKVRLRVAKAYRNYVARTLSDTTIVSDTLNGSNPYYEFNIPSSVEISTNVSEEAKSALDMIRVVPNPYYAYSSYERTREDQLDNRIRITNLPSHCTISIYTLNGSLVRQIKRDVMEDVSAGQAVEEGRDDNLSSTIDWDLKNTAGIPVASGVYYFHIDAGDLGQRVVKWLGVIRPIDLDTF